MRSRCGRCTCLSAQQAGRAARYLEMLETGKGWLLICMQFYSQQLTFCSQQQWGVTIFRGVPTEGKGCCGYHASASGARQLKVAYFFYFLYVSKLEERRERGLRRTGEPCCFLFATPKQCPSCTTQSVDYKQYCVLSNRCCERSSPICTHPDIIIGM